MPVGFASELESMRTDKVLAAGIVLTCVLWLGAAAQAKVAVEFFASSPLHEHEARAYQAIWDEYGERIVTALEARTCLAFAESSVSAEVAEAVSHSGGPEHPMRLRASYALEVKKSTLVHELGHRHLWQLVERLDDVDGHQTLYLVLDLVWADVWGERFAEDRVRGESSWRSRYDYAGAWSWARSLAPAQRMGLWNELLAMNGLGDFCSGLAGSAE